MNRVGVFLLGVVVGCVALQVGHALYLRSVDYVEAALWTGFVGVMTSLLAHTIAEEWD